MMTPRTRLALAGVAVVLLALAVLKTRTTPAPVAEAPVPPAAAADDGAPRFVAGRTDAYAVTWTTEARSALPVGEASLTVASHLEGTLHLTTWSVEPEQVVQSAALVAVDALRVVADGHAIPVDPARIVGVPARVVRDGRGELVDVSFGPGAPEEAQNALTGLLRASLVEHPGDGSRWATYGEALDAWDGEVRTTSGYLRVDGSDAAGEGHGLAAVRWGRGGRLVALAATDAVTAEALDATDAVTLAWSGSVARPVAPPAASAVVAALGATAPRSTLAARARGLSGADVLAAVAAYDGTDPEVAEDLMWRGTARLALEPELARRVADRIAAGMPHPARELGLDLLAHTPAVEVQGDLRDALDALRTEPAFPAYLSRLAFVEAPDAATVAWLHARLQATEPAVRRAALATTGAVARRIASRGGDPGPVLGPVRAVAGPDRPAALAGLGNAVQPEDLPALLDAAGDPDPTVRAAAVHALRHYEDDRAATARREAVRDPVPVVQRAALSRLSERPLGPEDRAVIRDVAVQGAVAASNLQLAVAALAEDAADPVARQALAALVSHPAGDPASRARIRALLDD